MIIKAWVKFTGMDVECICTNDRCKDCGPGYGCEKYVVKFVPIMSLEDDSVSGLCGAVDKTTKEIEKVNRKIRRLL